MNEYIYNKNKKLKEKIDNQNKIIKQLKNIIKNYAPYMKFPDEK